MTMLGMHLFWLWLGALVLMFGSEVLELFAAVWRRKK